MSKVTDLLTKATEALGEFPKLDGDKATEKITEATESLSELSEALEASITEAADTAAKEAVTKFTADLAELADEEGGGGDEGDPSDITKRKDIPEDVRKRFEQLEDVATKATERVTKMEEAARDGTFVAKATESYPYLGNPSDIGPVLRKIADACPDEWEVLSKGLDSTSEQMRTNKIFEEIGSKGGDNGGGTVTDKFNVLTTDVAKAKNLSESEALREVAHANPELYQEYLTEQRARSRN